LGLLSEDRVVDTACLYMSAIELLKLGVKKAQWAQ
jgi:hypothetical protein